MFLKKFNLTIPQLSYFFVVFLLALSSCKKDSSSNSVTDEFIEFELDGVLHRIANNPVAGYSISGISENFSCTGGTQKHPGYPADHVLAVSFAMNADEKLKMHKIYSQAGAEMYSSFVFGITKPPGTKVKTYIGGNGAWEFHLTQFSGKGKISEGTFSYQSVKELDENDNVVATNHAITKGKFKLLVHD